MADTYTRYEVLTDPVSLPTWTTTWIGSDGCGNRTVYYGSPTVWTRPPTQAYDTYEPESVRVFSQSSNKSYGRRKSGPPYRYTPYVVSREVTKRHLIRRLDGTDAKVRYYQYGIVPKIGSSCVPTPTSAPFEGPLYASWNVVSRDYYGLTNYVTHEFNSSDISDAIAEAEDDVARDAMSSYDLLTDIMEIKDVPRLVTQVTSGIIEILHGLRSRHGRDVMRGAAKLKPLDLLKHPYKAFRRLGEDWMAYRYGVMPLVYSYRDAMKTLARHQNVKSRSFRSVYPRETGVSLPGSGSTFRRTRIEGSIIIRGNVFQSFSSDEVAKFSGFGFNPLVTAWELIPYSFVADWFVNTGDYIARRTNQSWARQKWACLSRRDSYTTYTEVHLPAANKTLTVGVKTPTNWWGALPPTPDPVVLQNPEGYFLLEEKIVNSYSRWLFDVAGGSLRWNPSLSWRRLIDGSVLSLNLLRSLLRSFR